MAVSKVAQSTSLVIKVQTGTNASGNPVYANRSYTNVKTAATDADIYAVGQELSAMQKYNVTAIERRDLSALVNA